MKLLCDATSFSPAMDLNTGGKPTIWRGADITLDLALALAGTLLLPADIGTITLEIKGNQAAPSDSPFYLAALGTSDCDPSFTALAWTTGQSPLVTHTIPYADCALPPGTYLLIVRHESPSGGLQTHLCTSLTVRENHSESISVSLPPSPAVEYWTKTEADSRYPLATSFTALSATVAGHTSSLATLSSTVTGHTSSISALSTTVTGHTSSISTNTSSIATLTSGKRNKATRYPLTTPPTITTTAVVITDFNVTLAANKTYRLKYSLRVTITPTATGRGLWLNLKASGSLTYLDGTWSYHSLLSVMVFATGVEAQPASSAATTFLVTGEFEIATTSISNVTLEARQGTTGSGSMTHTLSNLSRLEVEELF